MSPADGAPGPSGAGAQERRDIAMRTITYILTGRPRNRTDCIDYAQTHRAKKISAELMASETVSEAFVARNLYATYIWVFAEFVVTYEEVYGRCFQHEPAARQRVSIDNANRRLERALENLRQRTGMAIEGDDARFGYELAYPPEAPRA